MNIPPKKRPKDALPWAVKLWGGVLLSFSLLVFSQSAAYAVTSSGDSTTILRLRESTQDDQLFQLYEYLHLSGTEIRNLGALSFHLGGWGRVDLGEMSSDQRTDGVLQYGFLSYRANRNNLQFNVGRQFVVEGIAAERLDGLYLRSDLAAGFTAAAFVGAPVVSEPNLGGGELIYGSRVAHAVPKYYSIGFSALRNQTSGDGLREEQGVDLWLHPMQQVDITGRSSYNSLSSGWMEHAYAAGYTPMESLRLGLSLQQINYDDYFYHVTTSALSLTNGLLVPGEELLNFGGSIGFIPATGLGISTEYNHYQYDIAGSANYYGARASFSTPTAFTAGVSFHRMDGSTARFEYNQYRAWATQKFGPGDVTLDFFDVDFDGSINGRSNTYSLAAAAGYDFDPSLRVAADIDYQKSADFDHELRGLIKVSYAFGFGKEGKE